QRSILPHGLTAANEIAAGEIARGKIVVARNRNERTLQSVSHVFNEACLATASRPLQHDGQAASMALFKDLYLVPSAQVKWWSLRFCTTAARRCCYCHENSAVFAPQVKRPATSGAVRTAVGPNSITTRRVDIMHRWV